MAASNAEKPQETPKKRRLFLRSTDTIFGQVGDNARNVVVGKNVIQIGKLNIPLWAVVLFGVAFVAILGLLLFVNSDKLMNQLGLSPVRLPAGAYGVAVAPFFDPAADDAELKNEGIEKAASLSRYLSTTEDVFASSGEVPTIYGPEQRIQSTTPAEVAGYAAEIHADLIVYGQLDRISAQRWRLTPRFYVAEDAMARAPELTGDEALGAPIIYRVGAQQAAQREVNLSLQDRVKTIVTIATALSYLDQKTLSGYEDAVALLAPLEENSAWARDGRRLPGQEILYAFMGRAFLMLADAISELDQGDYARAEVHLNTAERLLTAGKAINPSYPRVLVGLGDVYYQKGIRLRSSDCMQAALPYLIKARQEFNAGVQELQPTAGTSVTSVSQLSDRALYLNALFGLARVDFYRFYCDSMAGAHHRLVEDALTGYNTVIDNYNQAPHPSLQLTAIYAHLESATILRDALAGVVALPSIAQPGAEVADHLEEADLLVQELDEDSLNRRLLETNERVCADWDRLLPQIPEFASIAAYCENVQSPV